MPARPVRTFTVLPRLPERLLSLHELAYNLWWCWHADAVALFRRIDADRFEQLDHSPIRLLTSTTQARFEELATDDGFIAHLDRVWEAFQTYLSAPTWFADQYPDQADLRVAYFSAEFGIHESVPVYSGGLGVLAGDHLKSASDAQTRMQQEIVLGIGGLRALRALGKEPTVCHMNEGHSAFAALERARVLVEEKGFDFATAIEAVKAGTVFTTHTPVPAGNDAFPPHMIDQYLGEFMKALRVDRHAFLALGREHAHHEAEHFSMTVLAIRTSNVSNGVSKLHGVVSRKMWQNIFPGLPDSEVPIKSITNGVHTQSWVAPEMGALFDRYLGHAWQDKPTAFEVGNRAEHIP